MREEGRGDFSYLLGDLTSKPPIGTQVPQSLTVCGFKGQVRTQQVREIHVLGLPVCHRFIGDPLTAHDSCS